MAINGFYNYPLSWKPDRAKLTRPVYLSLARQLKEDIASGCLAPVKYPHYQTLALRIEDIYYRQCVLFRFYLYK